MFSKICPQVYLKPIFSIDVPRQWWSTVRGKIPQDSNFWVWLKNFLFSIEQTFTLIKSFRVKSGLNISFWRIHIKWCLKTSPVILPQLIWKQTATQYWVGGTCNMQKGMLRTPSGMAWDLARSHHATQHGVQCKT